MQLHGELVLCLIRLAAQKKLYIAHWSIAKCTSRARIAGSISQFHCRARNKDNMPTYTILGGTGNGGTALIELLLQRADTRIKVYCRNQEKLWRLIPATQNHPRVEVFTGNITDIDLFAKALDGARAAFLVASTNDNVPGCRISQDLARTVISALERKKKEQDNHIPKLVLLSSATIDPWISREHPWVNAIIRRSAWHVYRDLELAEAHLRQNEDWAPCVYIKPGGLSVDKQRGHRLTLDEEESFVSYADIAAGMIEAADAEPGAWNTKNVGVVNTNGGAKFPPGTPRCIVLGLLRFYFPMLHAWLPTGAGPV